MNRREILKGLSFTAAAAAVGTVGAVAAMPVQGVESRWVAESSAERGSCRYGLEVRSGEGESCRSAEFYIDFKTGEFSFIAEPVELLEA